MDLRHQKISTAADSADPDEVQGGDWNDPHALAAGSMTPLAMVRLYWDPVEGFDPIDGWEGSSRITSVTRISAGNYAVAWDASGLHVAAGTTQTPICVPTIIGQGGSLDADEVPIVLLQLDGTGVIQFYDTVAAANVDPAIRLILTAMVYLDVS